MGRNSQIPTRVAVTRLVGIEVQVGKMGSLTPVVVLEPVELGVRVWRVSFFNWGRVEDLLGGGGDGGSGVEEEVWVGGMVLVT